MKKTKKKYKKPIKPWNKERMDKESVLLKIYGLRRKHEIWKAGSMLRSFRRRARNLAAGGEETERKVLLDKLYNMGVLDKNADLDDVLSLNLENLLERRLQTMVFKKKLANTPRQARQFITHGHIAIGGRRTVYPSFFVTREFEDKISYYGSSPIKKTKVKQGD
jgi:small subunit ribosomal protein S4